MNVRHTREFVIRRNTKHSSHPEVHLFGFWLFRHFLIQKIAISSIGCKRSRLFTLVELERMPKPQYGLVFYPAAVCRLYIETHDRVRYINQSLASGLPMVFCKICSLNSLHSSQTGVLHGVSSNTSFVKQRAKGVFCETARGVLE